MALTKYSCETFMDMLEDKQEQANKSLLEEREKK